MIIKMFLLMFFLDCIKLISQLLKISPINFYQKFYIIISKKILFQLLLITIIIIKQRISYQKMLSQQPLSIKTSHNLFLHRFLDNNQAQSTTFMKLDTHSTLYHDGTQNKYLTNLIVAGRNFIQLYAIFQNQLTLNLGCWQIYQDIKQVQQWDKTIVISTCNKIVGLVYEDCMLKNSFMLTLDFLQLGFRQQISTICDKFGYYMLIATSRQILLCISQKSVHRYKAKPFSHRKMSIIQQVIKWNRPQYQSIVDVVKFQFYDFDLARVEGFHFCDQYLYFMGYTNKIGMTNKKFLYQLPIQQIFSDNQKESLILQFAKLDDDVKQSYVIRRDSESQFLIVKKNIFICIRNQRGQIIIENQIKSNLEDLLICRKNNNPLIFPLYIFHKNTVYIYQRSPTSGLSVALYFTNRTIKLPQNLQVQFCDIQDGLFAYCNKYQVGLINMKSIQANKQNNMTDQKLNQLQKIVLKQSFGSIIDFNIGQNILLIENTYKTKCHLKLLRKGIVQNPKPFIMVPKKIALQKIQQIKSIRSLQQLLQNQYQLTESQAQLKRIRQFLLNYLIIQTKNDSYNLYKLINGPNYQFVMSGFIYWTLVKSYQSKNSKIINQNKQLQLQPNKWYLIFYTSESEMIYYEIILTQNNQSLNLIKKVPQIFLFPTQKTSKSSSPLNQSQPPPQLQIRTIKSYIISISEIDLTLTLYNWNNHKLSTIKLKNQAKDPKFNIMKVNYKSITFKKKDKDHFILQVLVILDQQKLQIHQVSAYLQQSKLSHTTENIGQGLAILLPSQSPIPSLNTNFLNHQFRAITCPQYTLSDKTNLNQFQKSPTVIKLHLHEYQTQNFLFIINSREQLQVYKKVYCSNYNISLQHTVNNNIGLNVGIGGINTNLNIGQMFGSIDTGFLYYRQPLPLNIIKKWKYNQATAFVDVGCGMLRVCNFVFFKGELLQFAQNIRSCFKISQDEIWAVMSDSKLKPLITSGKILSHYLTTTVKSSLNSQLIGIDSTNQMYIIYSKTSFEVFDKQLNSTWLLNLNQSITQNMVNQNKQRIISICAYDHYVAVSYCNYCQDQLKEQYKSVKFKLRIYNTITKKKIIQKQNAFEQPVLHIRFVPPDKLIIVTSSNISVNTIKNNQSLQNPKNKYYSKRSMLSCFSYHPQKVGIQPGYMIFGGLYGGLSFYVGQWIDKDKLDQIWFENLKCGVCEVQIFHYGGPLQVLKAIVADDSQNILVLDLKPKNADKIADFHIGSPITSIKKRNQIPYIASQDGCIRMLLPIKLKDPQINFLDFQQQITKSIPILCGFNTRDSRLLNQRQKTYKLSSQGNIVDGELIRSFFSLTQNLKKNINNTTDISIDNLKNQLLGQL